MISHLRFHATTWGQETMTGSSACIRKPSPSVVARQQVTCDRLLSGTAVAAGPSIDHRHLRIVSYIPGRTVRPSAVALSCDLREGLAKALLVNQHVCLTSVPACGKDTHNWHSRCLSAARAKVGPVQMRSSFRWKSTRRIGVRTRPVHPVRPVHPAEVPAVAWPCGRCGLAHTTSVSGAVSARLGHRVHLTHRIRLHAASARLPRHVDLDRYVRPYRTPRSPPAPRLSHAPGPPRLAQHVRSLMRHVDLTCHVQLTRSYPPLSSARTR
jgi:hypothetical protein